MRFARVLALSGLVVLTAALVSAVEPALPKRGKASAKKVLDNSASVASNDLAFDLYARLASANKGQSLFFSPYSISSALVMVAEGARAETADEMGKVLRLPKRLRQVGPAAGQRPWDLGPIHAGLETLNKQFAAANRPPSKKLTTRLARLRKELESANRAVRSSRSFKAAEKAEQLAAEINRLQAGIDRYEVRVANALWGEKTYPFKESYLRLLRKHYGTSAFPVDFIKGHEAARQRINAWVEKQTRDRIKELIPPKAIDESTRLVVANAIYFKGQWLKPFEEAQTQQRPFTLAGGKTVKVATMHGYPESARYAAFHKDGTFFDTPKMVERGSKDTKRLYPGPGGFELLELPYKGGDLAMVVVVPRSADGLPALEKMLNSANLREWVGKLRQRSVEVFLPKFKLESSYSLKEPLTELGMKRAFRDPRFKDGAQLDGLSEAKEPENKLHITKVLHKAFVEVSEKGTEAAAATAIVGAPGAAAPRLVPFTPTFKADKPFVFLIRDRKTGTVLFLGRIVEPKKAT
jgi:serine protease inhibitor